VRAFCLDQVDDSTATLLVGCSARVLKKEFSDDRLSEIFKMVCACVHCYFVLCITNITCRAMYAYIRLYISVCANICVYRKICCTTFCGTTFLFAMHICLYLSIYVCGNIYDAYSSLYMCQYMYINKI